MARQPQADLYISADIEADGPIPGTFSMLSFGLAVAARYDGREFVRATSGEATFYRELQPISERFESEALAVSGLDREQLQRTGQPPRTAMSEAYRWVRDVAGDARPVLVAYPLSYDWLWLYWYFVSFSDERSPFGHSSCLDIKTLYQQKAGVVVSCATKRQMPRSLMPGRRHTHHALDDAIEQGELFANIWEWDPAAG
ncbi:MAG TPA: 3'-5' exoribonuclease [Gaiellaceae bacterium]